MKTIPNEKRFSGSIVLERGMFSLCKRNNLLKYSHAETLLYNENEKYTIITNNKGRRIEFLLEQNTLYTVGIRGNECKIRRAVDYYGKRKIIILVPKALTHKGADAQWKYIKYIKPSNYQGTTKRFRWFITDNKINYSYKLAAKLSDHIGLWIGSTDIVSVNDLYKNPNYETYQ